MTLVRELSNYTKYQPSNDLISMLGDLSDESNAISTNYTNKYLSDIYDMDSYIASKIYNYDKVNEPVYSVDLGLTLVDQVSENLIIPNNSSFESQDGVLYISSQPLVIDAFSQILSLSLIRGQLQSQVIDTSTLISSKGKCNLVKVNKANYISGYLLIDNVEYSYNEYAPYNSDILAYSVSIKPNGDIYLIISESLMRLVTNTSNIVLNYIVDENDSTNVNITRLSTTFEGSTYTFTDIITYEITSNLAKSTSFDYETLMTRFDYYNLLKSIPIVQRSTVYTMSDLILKTAHEVEIVNNSGESQMSNDIDLVYVDDSGTHYVPYYAYFVVELLNYQTLDNLTRNFIMNYLNRGLLLKEVLLTYGNKLEVSPDGGNYNPEYKPSMLAHLVDSRNAIGNYTMYSPTTVKSETQFSTPGYNCPDLFVQLVQAKYVSVDISIKLSINYKDSNDLTNIGLQLLSSLRQFLYSDKFTFNSTLTLYDVEDLCYQNPAVTYVIVEPFNYSRPGDSFITGVDKVEASPFELLVLGKLSLLLDIITKNVEDEFTISESSLTNKWLSYEDQSSIEDSHQLIIKLHEGIDASDYSKLSGNSITLPRLELSLVNYIVEVGKPVFASNSIKSAGSTHVYTTHKLFPKYDESNYQSDTPESDLNNPPSSPWSLITDISDKVDEVIIDSNIEGGKIK